jgi:hypothetical protein
MTASNDMPDRPADAGEVMSPKAVAQMERRLLDAFSQHYHQAGRLRRRRARWIGIAATLAMVAGAGATWLSLHVHPWPLQLVTEAPATRSDAGKNIASASSAPRMADASAAPPASSVVGGTRLKPSPSRVRSGRLDAPAVKPAAFIALPGAASLPTFESGAIVRMDLELSSLAAFGLDISAAGGRSPVQADLLVGQDGEPRAIRVVNSSWDSSSPSRSRQ